jgi:hypothetical protein
VSVGLDLGTSSTKVAFRVLGGPKAVRPIVFDHGVKGYPGYCLPSVVAVDRSGKPLLGSLGATFIADQPFGRGISRLKVLVAGQYDKDFRDAALVRQFEREREHLLKDWQGVGPDGYLAASLGWQLAEVRRKLVALLRTSDLDITYNVCVPISQVDKSPVLAAFRRILRAGAKLADALTPSDGPFSDLTLRAQDLVTCSSGNGSTGGDSIFAVPEAVAQVAGYMVSQAAREGLHAVVDIGAGTTDVSIMFLQAPKTSEAASYWLAAHSHPFAGSTLECEVAEFLDEAGEQATQGRVAATFARLAERREKRRALLDALELALERIRHRTNPTWVEAFSTKLRRQSFWEGDKVRLFLAGAPSHLPRAANVFKQCWMSKWPPFDLRPIPTPDDYVGGSVPFNRMNVAYGLSIPVPMLRSYVLPKDAHDMTPIPQYRDPYSRQDGDQIIARDGWC